MVESGVWPVTRPEGLCHMVDGGSNRPFGKFGDVFGRVGCLPESLCEGTDDGVSGIWVVEGGEEGVVAEFDVGEEFLPARPATSSLVLGGTSRSCFSGIFASSEQSHEFISCRSGTS